MQLSARHQIRALFHSPSSFITPALLLASLLVALLSCRSGEAFELKVRAPRVQVTTSHRHHRHVRSCYKIVYRKVYRNGCFRRIPYRVRVCRGVKVRHQPCKKVIVKKRGHRYYHRIRR